MSRFRLAHRATVFGCLTLLTAALPAAAVAADAPPWLSSLVRQELTAAEAKADAVVLHDEVRVTVAADGRLVTRRSYAVRVVTGEGQDAAAVREVYGTDAGEIRTMRGWVITDGRTIELGRGETVDLALADNDVYNESRVRVLSAGRVATPGVTFGAETETAERVPFTQLEWPLQQTWPVRSLRRVLTVPPGGAARSVTFNASPIEPILEGTSYTWSVRDLPAVRPEPSSPPLSGIVPRLSVTYDVDGRRQTAFESWTQVANWLETLTGAQASVTPALTEKAKSLVAAATTDLERVRAIGQFAQQVQYISVQTGLGRGGGYKPHAAADVLSKNYGDCKDKANLMKALLATVGLKAHLVTIYSGDPDYVRAEWPSPQQFNHAIVAVLLPAAVDQPAATIDPVLGPVLFFDPTDEYTPVGELPRYLQGSQGLVVRSDGALVRMPSSKPDANPSVRRIEGALGIEGGLVATLQHVTAGEPASLERQLYRSRSREDYTRLLEVDLRRQVANARLVLGTIGDDPATNRFSVTMKVDAPAFAQSVNRLLLVRPPGLTRLSLPELSRGPRAQPLQLDFYDLRDTFDIAMPAGATVDEIPEPRSMTTAFGRYSVRWQVNDGRVVRSVLLQVTRGTLAPAAVGEVSAFFDSFREAERLPVVLLRR